MGNNREYNFVRSLLKNYITTTLDGNYVSFSNYGSYYVIWREKEFNEDESSISIIYFDGRYRSGIKEINNIYLTEDEIEKLKIIKENSIEQEKKFEDADNSFKKLIISNIENNKERNIYSFRRGMQSTNNHFDYNIDFYNLSNEELENFIFSEDYSHFIKWGKNNNSNIRSLYNKFGLYEYIYRNFRELTDYEIIELLNMVRLISGRRVNVKAKRGQLIVSQSPYIEKVLVGDLFYDDIRISKTIETTRTEREWIPEKRGREWDGMDWSSYTIPGYYEERTIRSEEEEEYPVDYRKILIMKEHCLKKQVVPDWMRKEKLK